MLIYIDIETVHAYRNYSKVPERVKELWEKKMKKQIEEEGEKPADLYYDNAAFFSEFNKIICVSLGYIKENAGVEKIVLKSFFGHDEKQILLDLSAALGKAHALCAHFGKGFDFPQLARKYRIHELPIPPVLNTMGLKPWEVNLIDTQDLWKFWDMRYSASLDLLAHTFGLPSPKEIMDGSEVSDRYYGSPEGVVDISRYCEDDVRTLINVHRRIIGDKTIDSDRVEKVTAEIKEKTPVS